MEIILQDVGKRYGNAVLFKGINLHLKQGSTLAILGRNGSGKSTLLQMIFSYSHVSKGFIKHALDGKQLTADEVVTHAAFASPYMELPAHLTLNEAVQFHFAFKEKRSEADLQNAIADLGLAQHGDKQIKNFSSGMKQRLKLVLALCTQSSLLLLDEPCANFDESGIAWYKKQIQYYTIGRTTIVASNLAYEYEFCQQSINIETYS